MISRKDITCSFNSVIIGGVVSEYVEILLLIQHCNLTYVHIICNYFMLSAWAVFLPFDIFFHILTLVLYHCKQVKS